MFSGSGYDQLQASIPEAIHDQYEDDGEEFGDYEDQSRGYLPLRYDKDI